MTHGRPSPTDGDELARARVRAQVRGIAVTGLDASAIEDAIADHEADLAANPPWLLPGTTAVAGTATALEATADTVATSPAIPAADALAEVLRNAAGHLPAFSGAATRPYGCVVCGSADGTGACDTWLAGLRLAAALEAEVGTRTATVGDSGPGAAEPTRQPVGYAVSLHSGGGSTSEAVDGEWAVLCHTAEDA